MKRNKVVLIILDGWGLRDATFGNAIRLAKPSHFQKLWQTYPHAILATAGEAVGLPIGQIGASEVSHMTIGAGRVIFHDLVRINLAIENKTFFKIQRLFLLLNMLKNIHLLYILKD